jgi:NitT/TauT family transport system substrate-binding protein
MQRIPDIFGRLAGAGALCLALVLGTAGGIPAEALKPMRFIPQWSPQSQFAGYYVALAKGYYRKHGLAVTILRGGPDAPAGAALAAGEADLATLFLSSGLQLRARGVPVVNVGQIVQHSALMLVAKKSRGILAPADLEGKRVSLWDDFAVQPRAFFRRHGLYVEIIPQGYTLNLFLMDGVDAASAMRYNEYHSLLNAGLDADELTTFHLADLGFDFPEDGIYCLAQTLNDRPEAVRGFVQASLEGWREAFAHPEQALAIVMDHVRAANLPTNRVHQKWMLEQMAPLIFPPGSATPPGVLAEDVYKRVAADLFEAGIINDTVPYRTFHDPRPSAR